MKTGQDLVNLAKTKLGSGYQLGILVPKDDSNYKGKFDCSELVVWCYYQLTGKLYGCLNNNGKPNTADAFTGYLDRDAHSIGKIITITEAANTPGALLLRVASNRNVGHVVISQGFSMKTVEANSTKYGLIESTINNRRWDYGILLPEIDYTEDINARPYLKVPNTLRLTSPMMINDTVGKVQEVLNTLILSDKNYRGITSLEVDNIYGENTYMLVREFQRNNGLVPDGEVGPITAKELGLHIYGN